MHIALLSPVAWRTPPRHYGPWENIVSLLAEGLVVRNQEVSLFATGDSITQGELRAVCPRGYEEDTSVIPKVVECLHISELFEAGDEFDVIHNNFDYLPLTYSAMTSTPLITTIHGFSSPKILPVYEKYQHKSHYISISDADRAPSLRYLSTIHHGIELSQFSYQAKPHHHLVFFGRIHDDKGTRQAIEIAKGAGIKLLIAGIIQDQQYYDDYVAPHLVPGKVEFIGRLGSIERNYFLGNALALLHPIQFNEPFGLSVIEAMACGTPVIAFNRGSMPELIQHGSNGFLVHNVEQAIAAIKQLSNINRQDCRSHVEAYFSADRMVDDYLAVYKHIVANNDNRSHRPWGHFTVLKDADQFKAKEIVVLPGKRLSLQRHLRRAEHWLIIQGTAIVTLKQSTFSLRAGESVDIPIGMAHRIENAETTECLRFIEIQTGSYFGENDIERLEDDYGRA